MKERLKIALINPRIESYSSTLPPLGLLYIAALLEKDGFYVKVFDFYHRDDRDLPGLISYNPNVVGMTVLTDYLPRAVHLSKIIRQKLSNAIFIIGGIHITALPVKSMYELNADIGVRGEGEYTMLQICNRLASSSDWRDVAGIIYRDGDGSLIQTPGRPYTEQLDVLPFPARHLLNFEDYLVPPGMIRGFWSERSTTIMTSRGCPFSCIWCGSQCTFGRKVRYRSVDNVIKEINLLVNDFAIDAIWFVDDTFTLDKKRVLEFCQKLISEKVNLKWGCQAHIKTADEEMFSVMKDAGLVQLDFGVESGSDRVLKALKKNSDAGSIKNAFAIAKKVGIRTCATFMFGSPMESKEDIQATYRLAEEINPNFTSSYFITPYPGTELMEMAMANKWTLSKDRHECGLKKRPMLLINFSEQKLLKIRKKFQKKFVLRNFFSPMFSRRYFFGAFKLFLSYPGGFFYGIKTFFKTFVFDDFLFAFINYYIMHKTGKVNKA